MAAAPSHASGRTGEHMMGDSPSMKRRLAAILAADIAGYSRLMGEDEATTVRDLKGHQAVILPLVGRYDGRIIDTAGDGILAEFPSVINATECAVEIQTIMATRNEGVPESRRMRFRIGINLGDVIHDESRIYGDGINVAARLEGIAEPGGICISRQVFDQVSRALKADFQALGPRTLKNIAQPVDVFAIAPADRVPDRA
jgi:adenylate cyclase